MRQKGRSIERSVAASHEHSELVIGELCDIHEELVELVELVRKLAEPNPLDPMRKIEPLPPKLEEKPVLSLRSLFRRGGR